MIFKNEKQLLKIIKYTPSLFVIAISFIILTFQFIEKNNSFEQEKLKIKTEFTQKNKNLIKQRVDEVYNFIKREQLITNNDLKKSLQIAINNALAIASTIYENNKDKDINEVKKLVVQALRNIRFNKGRGYYFIYEKTAKNILLPHNKEFEGKSFWNHQDAKGTYIVRKMINLLSTKEQAFCEWYWFNPTNKDKQRKKIGLVKNFAPFNWFIGTGEYLGDFEHEVQSKILKHIKEIRFGKNGYIFIIDYDTNSLTQKENYIENTVITNNDSINIKKVRQELIKIAKEGEGYYSYIQKKDANNNPVRKISFVKGLNEWEWMIGTGFYEDDIQISINKKREELNKQFKQSIYHTLEITLLVVIFLLLISIYFSKILQNRFTKYRQEIEQHILDNQKQHNIMAQQSKMAAMGEMIGNIAHQWRQPLSTITTTATGIKIQKEMNVLDDDFLTKGLDGINNSAQYLSSTIDDFRNFFKTDKKEAVFSLKEALEKAISLLYVQFHNKDIEIIKDIKDIEIINLKNELIQVIINLLNNSRDELIKKDKKVKKLVFIETNLEDAYAIIKIKDNAGGIPEEIIDRIFEPYFTTKHQAQGTGIGLYMSQEIIVKNMEGSIKVYNDSYNYEGKEYDGAIFEIKIPISK